MRHIKDRYTKTAARNRLRSKKLTKLSLTDKNWQTCYYLAVYLQT